MTAFMTDPSRRAILFLGASALGAVVFAGDAPAQVYYEDRVRPRRRRPRYEPDDELDDGSCQPMCAQDLSPCDSPAQKAADGRCSSPTGGALR